MDPRKIAAWALLLIGISMAAAFGSRNGQTHTDFRRANGEVAVICGEICGRDPGCAKACVTNNEVWPEHRDKASKEQRANRREAISARDSIGLPPPRKRLMGWAQVGGLGWLLGVVFIGGGAFLARKVQAEEVSGTGEGASDAVDFSVNVDDILDRLGRIQTAIADLPYDDDAPSVREDIDVLFEERIMPVVDDRGRLIARHGIGGFAEYFGPFAAGERNLARCWSGLTDGHAEVAREALQNSIESFQTAKEAYAAQEKAMAPTS